MKNAFTMMVGSFRYTVFKAPHLMRDTLGIIAGAVKRHPVKYCLLTISLLLLAGLGVREHLSPLPSHRWNVRNLKEIDIHDPKEFSFAVFGNNRNSKFVFESLLILLDHDPDITFAVSLGDMVQTGDKERYRWFLQQNEKYLGIPLVTVMGNHERRGEGPGLYHAIFGPSYYSFNIGKNYFIVLDNSNRKRLDPEKKRWLVSELEKSQDGDSRIVFMHVPLYDPRGGSHQQGLPEKTSETLIELFRKYNVTHIFASHIQGHIEGKWRGIPFTITGGAGAGLRGYTSNHDFFHYLKVNIKSGSVHVEAKRVPFPLFEKMGSFSYATLLYFSSFLRFHGIETLLLLAAAGLAVAIFRGESRGAKMKH